MSDEYISREDAIRLAEQGQVQGFPWQFQMLLRLSSADVLPYSIDPDGTMTVTVPKGTKRIGRILIVEDGTRYGGIFYPDTGGCFLSSMEGE